MKQNIFQFPLKENFTNQDFFVSNANLEAFNFVSNRNNLNNIFLQGPAKSGKTHLGLIWKNNNNATLYDDNNYEEIIQSKNNIYIDNLELKKNEEYLFHLINHCNNNKLSILICSRNSINQYNFKLQDLNSRLKSFHYISIKEPDDELINNLLMKLFYDRQIIIKNAEIFSYIIKRIGRTYLDIYLFVEKIDKLSLEKKRELTIPLVKELI